jgi:hypothetical protein
LYFLLEVEIDKNVHERQFYFRTNVIKCFEFYKNFHQEINKSSLCLATISRIQSMKNKTRIENLIQIIYKSLCRHLTQFYVGTNFLPTFVRYDYKKRDSEICLVITYKNNANRYTIFDALSVSVSCLC